MPQVGVDKVSLTRGHEHSDSDDNTSNPIVQVKHDDKQDAVAGARQGEEDEGSLAAGFNKWGFSMSHAAGRSDTTPHHCHIAATRSDTTHKDQI